MNIQTFVITWLVVLIAEMGDKTQLMVMAMASKYKLRDIFTGIILAVMLLNLLATGLGAALSRVIPLKLIHLLAGAAFLLFALWSVWEKEADDKKNDCTFFGRLPAYITVGVIFFMAELGDKTQLYIISVSAANPAFAPAIFWGAAFGLVLADAVGLTAGLLLSRNMPTQLVKWFSYCAFSCFGLVSLDQNLPFFFSGYEKGHLVFIALIFVGLTAAVEKAARQKSATIPYPNRIT